MIVHLRLRPGGVSALLPWSICASVVIVHLRPRCDRLPAQQLWSCIQPASKPASGRGRGRGRGLWRFLMGSARHRLPLKRSDRHWRDLASAGHLWRALVGSGSGL